jgi:hypothetical protein
MARAVGWAVAAGLCVVLSGAAALAQEAPGFAPARGPAIGDTRYHTKIQNDGVVADVDDYVGLLLQGDSLTASVSAAKRSKLLPRMELVGPDGAVVPLATRPSRGGAGAQIRHFVAPTSGRWTVRISGANGTQGDYVVTFSVKPAPPQTLRARRLGEDEPLFKTETFHGLDGALLDLKLVWTKQSNPVELRALTDPAGDDVLAPDGAKAVEKAVVNSKRRSITLSKLPLHEGDGDYAMRVRIPQGTALYDVTFGVSPSRSKGRKAIVLSALEPVLDAQPTPFRGRPDFVMRLTGRNFSKSPAARAFFGLREGVVQAVADDGTWLDVKVPQGVPGTIVGVAVVNPDGQAAVRADFFQYLQPIKVLDLVDDDGAQVRVGSTRGGRRLHLVGENFETGQTVSFGDAVVSTFTVASSTEIVLETPGTHSRTVPVVIGDVFGGVAVSDFTFRFKAPPTFAARPYQPSVARVNTEVVVTISGADFEAADVLSFNGSPAASTFLGAQERRFTAPALPAGSYAVTLTDSIGSVERGPDFVVKPPPTISSVSLIGGPHVGQTGLAVDGGTLVRVTGIDFHVTDAVSLGGPQVQFTQHSSTAFTFVAPPGTLGAATLTVTDGSGQSASLAGLLRYVGYADVTSTRAPAASAVDDLLADRGAVGDLDRDGKADDLVIVSSYYAPGTRLELTRLFFGDSQGRLADATAASFPAAGSDASGNDNWNASAVAIGDVDRLNGADILIAGVSPYSYNGYVYKSVRLFRNDGAGHFTQDSANSPPVLYTPSVIARDQAGTYYLVYSTVLEGGLPTAMAIGDVDRDADGSLDVVVARDRYDFRYIGIDPTRVDFTQVPPYVATANVRYVSYFQYFPGTKVFQNDIAHANGFIDRTADWLPSVGDSKTAPLPAFHARDMALGDVDGDSARSLDIVETWDDPTTVSAFGVYMGPNVDSPRTATRVLLNDGHGRFTDATASWMPSAASPEFWQGSRLALADLDGDGRNDLVLLHAQGVDAYNTSPPAHSRTALRVLHNRGAGVGFVDVTATAIPSLPGNGDDFRGVALAVRDVDGDGRLDLVVGTNETLMDGSGASLRSTRLFRGGPNLTFTLDSAFLVPPSTDSGQAVDLLFLGDLSGNPDPSLVLLGNTPPSRSTNSQMLRVFDWRR